MSFDEKPHSSSAQKMKTRDILRWLSAFLRPYRFQCICAIICLIIGSLGWLLLGQGLRLLIDDGFLSGTKTQLNQAIGIFLTISVISVIATFGRFYLMSWVGERVTADIRDRVYARLITLSPSFFAKVRTGEVISRFTADSTLVQTVVGSSFSMALRSLVAVIGGIIMMTISSLTLSAIVLIGVTLIVIPISKLGKKVRYFARISQDRIADLGSHVDETLHEIRTVQAHSQESVEASIFSNRIESVMDAAKSRIHYRAILMALVMLLSLLSVILVAWIGALSVIDGTLTGGELSAFLYYALLVAAGVGTLSEVVGELLRASGATERLIELASTESDIKSPEHPMDFPARCHGKITFDKVEFVYPKDQAKSNEILPVFENLHFGIKAGERIALVGESGAGKSTIFALLQRFYDLKSGTILLDDIPINQISLNSLRQQYALVPQDAVIFASSVIDNVRYGNTSATENEVINACKAAKAHDFIEKLPSGYHTELGERGVKLSGGQKQRIAIARAILTDSPILLLDEATSALDAVNEKKVKLALDSLMAGRTSLVIAHRLVTVINADRILVLDKGKLIASGTHSELMQTSALYRDFANQQLTQNIDENE